MSLCLFNEEPPTALPECRAIGEIETVSILSLTAEQTTATQGFAEPFAANRLMRPYVKKLAVTPQLP